MAARAAISRPVGRAALLHEVQQVASTFVKYACAAYVVKTYLVSTTACTGPSMLPTFNTRGDRPWLPVPIPFLTVRGDLMVLERVSVLAKTIKVGDVVTAYSVQNPRHIVCKRVLGLEGDTIKVPWSSTSGPSRIVKVPQGHIWLQGDNLLNSTDSRHYGPVPYALLVGKAVAKAYASLPQSTEVKCAGLCTLPLHKAVRHRRNTQLNDLSLCNEMTTLP